MLPGTNSASVPLSGGLCGSVSSGCDITDRESEDLLFGRECMSSGSEPEEAMDQRVVFGFGFEGGGRVLALS